MKAYSQYTNDEGVQIMHVCTLLVIKMDFFFSSRSNIQTYCFFFCSFITLEQVYDYVCIMILDNVKVIYAQFCVTSHDLLFGAMEGQMCYIPSSFLLLAYVQLSRVFSGLTVTFVTKTDTNVL